MTDQRIGPTADGPAYVADELDPPGPFFDRAGVEISRARWDLLRGDNVYQQLRITNVTGLARHNPVFIRVHTAWTGIGAECGPPCSGPHIFETYVFDHFGFLAGLADWDLDLSIPWPWRDRCEALQGHDAIVSALISRVPHGKAQQDLTLTPTLDLRELKSAWTAN